MPSTSARMTGTAATKTSRIWNGNWIVTWTVMAQTAARRGTIAMKWKKHGIAANAASATMTVTGTETEIIMPTTTGTVIATATKTTDNARAVWLAPTLTQ